MELEILNSLKLRPGISNLPETLLIDFITDAIQDVKIFINYSDNEILPNGCKTIVKDLVVIKCNKLGSEGIASESHEGTSESYESDIPQEIKKKLYRYRRLRW
ncbi:phage head-tail connector protein [Clostridium tertium]|jgi:hypothetical protein|uniref:Phage head-tail connector protein n=1 Tax=Clostridium tertium TaxID=1559 RepID=A0A9X3XNE1_9CLOT|nr:phage head-tail connector protein [Clostridium tertium]MDC4242535.1 phage head-tail connector protein [Clostridium tertium]